MTIKWTAAERQERNAYRARERSKRKPKVKLDKNPVRLGGETVEIGKRPKMTDAQKAASHAAHEGLCYLCHEPVPMYGPEVQYDHKQERWEQGADTLDNIGPAHTVPCHAQKTARKTAERAHCDRMGKKHRREIKPKGQIKSAPFSGDYQPLPTGRGFR